MMRNAKCLALCSAVMMAPLTVAQSTAVQAQPQQMLRDATPTYLPLLPLPLDEFLAQHGGLTRLNLQFQDAAASAIAQEVVRQSGVDVIANDDLLDNVKDAPRFSFEA